MQTLLNRNETLVPPAPKCLKVLRTCKPHTLSQYAAGYFGSILADAVAKKYRFPREQVIVGFGSEDLLRHIFNTLDPAVDTVLTNDLHFTYYTKYLSSRKIALHTFAMIEGETTFRFDTQDCIALYRKQKPKLLLITSPNNPTGNVIPLPDLKKILSVVSQKTIVVMDEAYYGFDPDYDEQEFLSLLVQYPNLLLLRTFSKLYGLAGLRIGYALCGSKVKEMIQYQDRYLGMNRLAEDIAVAALTSPAYYKKIAGMFFKDRDSFISRVRKLKHITVYDSRANFVMIKPDKKMLPLLIKKMQDMPVLIARFVGENFLRVSLEPTRHTKQFLKIVEGLDKKCV